jgi:AraC-like DNA-binding protein
MRANVAGFAIPLTVTQNSDRHHVPSATTVLIESAVVATHESPPSTYSLLHAVSALISAVNCALSGESSHARQYLSAACHSLESEPTGLSTMPVAQPRVPLDKCRGGLAPWQIRCVLTHIEGHLSDNIHCEDLSELVNLSLSHFMRAFRDSFGCPPHAYVMKKRIERAQGLMLTTDSALGQIALECGLADQSHLSRLFHFRDSSSKVRQHGVAREARRQTAALSRPHGWVAPMRKKPLRYSPNSDSPLTPSHRGMKG